MKAKEYLNQAREAERQIEALAQRRQRCAELAEGGGPAGPELDALRRDLDGRIEAWAALVRQIEGRIDQLEDGRCRDVLKYRYLNGWSWQAIAARTGWSRDWLMKLQARALGEMERIRDIERPEKCPVDIFQQDGAGRPWD